MRWACLIAAVAWTSCLLAGELKTGESLSLRMGLDKEDTFVITGLKDWRVDVGRELPLRFGEVQVEPRAGRAFLLEMRFLCDTPDLAKYDTPAKMRRAALRACEQYVPESVEKVANLTEIAPGGRYGYFATFTDASLADTKVIPEGQHLYVTVGILRLTKDSALTFRLLSDSKDVGESVKAMDYVKSFVVPDAAKKPAP